MTITSSVFEASQVHPEVVNLAVSNMDAEKAMILKGIASYRRNSEKACEFGMLNKVENTILESAMPLVANHITGHINMMDEARAARGGKGKNPEYLKYIKGVSAELLADAVLSVSLQGVIHARPLTTLAVEVGAQVENLQFDQALQKWSVECAELIAGKAAADKGTSAKRKAWKAKRQAMDRGFEWDAYEDALKFRIGANLISMMLEATEDLFERIDTDIAYETGKTHTEVLLVLTPVAQKAIKQLHDVNKLLNPKFAPMLECPTPWTAFDTGAYKTPLLSRQVPLVSTSVKEHRLLIEAAIANCSMAPVLKALNVIQSVPLRVNEWVLSVVDQCVFQKIVVGESLPSHKEFEMPPVPTEPKEDVVAWAKYKRECAMTRKRNGALAAEWVQFKQDLQTARELVGKTFFLPAYLDFRGRVYAKPGFNHQRADHVRAMFLFDNGLPLGEDGAYWLAVTIAGYYDSKPVGEKAKLSKLSFKKREKWVRDNSDLIERCAHDPFAPEVLAFWSKADKPFNFLAAAREWAGYCEEGPEFVSRMPIPLDGSNSGLQHYSMALRDREAGKLVCLTPEEEPQDVYQSVADTVNVRLLEPATDPDQEKYRLQWIAHGVDRKTVKRCVMTFCYSSPQGGFAGHLRADIMEAYQKKVDLKEIPVHPFGDKKSHNGAANHLAGHNWQTVKALLPAAYSCMQYLKKCAELLAEEQKPVLWVAPNGFPVLCQNMKYKHDRVEVQIFNKEVKLTYALNPDSTVTDESKGGLKLFQGSIRTKPTGEIEMKSQMNGVAPNWVHSLDAAHLHLATNAAADAGITDVLLIHDSFSTHAANTGRYQQIIKQAFVDMYAQNDVVGQFEERVLQQLSADAKAKLARSSVKKPVAGMLDLNDVLKSDYCFA